MELIDTVELEYNFKLYRIALYRNGGARIANSKPSRAIIARLHAIAMPGSLLAEQLTEAGI